MNACKRHAWKGSYQLWLCALLALAILGDLAAPLLRSLRVFTPSGIGSNDGGSLDSFSKPSIAVAIIRTEADRLFNAYVHDRDLATDAATPMRPVGQPGVPAAGRRSSHGSSANLGKRATNIQALEKLSTDLQELEINVDRKLLAIYCQSDLWTEFLDRYLKFLREAPENHWVVTWAPCALLHAHRCGRGAEVVEALQHAIQTHANLRTALRLRAVLEESSTADSSPAERRTQ